MLRWAELGELEAEVLVVHPARRSDEVFQTLAWFQLLAQQGLDGSTSIMLCACAADSQMLQAALALSGDAGRGTGGYGSLANYYSSLYGPWIWPLAEGDAADGIGGPIQAIASGLARERSVPCLRLQPLDAQARWLAQLERALRDQAFLVDRFFCFHNWHLPCVDLRFDAYWASRPSPLRHSIERGRRRLAKAGAWKLAIHGPDSTSVAQAAQDFDTVYRQSWKQPEPFPEFIPSLIRTAQAEGWLRLGIVTLDGNPIAAQLWLVHAGKANIYKLAYVEGFERYSPGSVLTAAMMEHVLEVDRVHEVDYGMGDEPYKRDWMSHRRERVGLVAFNPRTWRGLSGAARHFGGRWLRKIIQPSERR